MSKLPSEPGHTETESQVFSINSKLSINEVTSLNIFWYFLSLSHDLLKLKLDFVTLLAKYIVCYHNDKPSQKNFFAYVHFVDQ